MSDQDPDRSPRRVLPPQPYQLLDKNDGFTPYYVPPAEANRFPGHVTPYLSNNLKHPAEEFAGPRNLFPGSDPITDARQGDGERPGQLSYEQVAALKDVKDMTVVERHARDAKEFTTSPPDALPQAQKQRWAQLYTELFKMHGESEDKEKKPKDKNEIPDQDPYKIRPRAELRKLKELADLAGGKPE
ncbi:hypothetical protein HO173_010285 [Letharia columbiana]|uniref:Uncharacterized protein n=1 Tax=Letharia columbiana TaxID=112416 RepID=A0A8H6FMZ9_9LECA|nr:uncharacterized protein HO173_010285 [Letharia columbiana]KAF6231533.1 hypothetical protein HO173_010285 [Letharia columbiana]